MRYSCIGSVLAVAAASPSTAQACDSYDYVIVGAGTSGLVVANRLSKDPKITVAVIDPGSDERGNPQVEDPLIWTSLLTTPLDWAYQSVPQ
ncbi:MAG: NAD(P)-binding protein, partial [Candidatus Binatia bacterium]